VELVCNDGNLCTNDSCDSEIGCSFVPNAADCDDGNACTVNDGCSKGWCAGGGQLDCDDENPCTNDACDFVDGCIHFDNAMACEDGNACTTGDLCAASLCVGGEPLNCDDDKVCTDDSCNPAIGCLNVANAAPCNDGNSCTTEDTCAKSSCQGGPAPDCNDDNACSEDTCDPDSGCVNTPLTGTECTDFTVCTDGDECVAGACIPGPALVCDDDDYCTNDSCDPIDGCASEVFAPCCGNGDLEAGEECDDGNQDDGDGCNGNCQMDGKLVPGNTTKIVSRQGFKIQCKEWSGDTCNRMWFSVPDPAITIKANCGVDDTTTLRPVWHGQTDEQCKTMCWIATGDSTCLASASGSGSGSHSGWMYGVGYNIGCDNDGRQYSQVTVPTVGNQVWSFDKFSWQRDGSFSSYRCNW
jgi:cysteine-rich repeat protein